MTQLIVLCSRPVQLAPSEAESWLRDELGALLGDSAVTHVIVTTLASASAVRMRHCDFLIEVCLRDGADPCGVVDAGTLSSLLGDFRLLGMRPSVAVATATHTVAGRHDS